jgi:hypothetical protein
MFQRLYAEERFSFEFKPHFMHAQCILHWSHSMGSQDVSRNGEAPCLLYACRGSGYSLQPFFRVPYTIFLKNMKGVLCVVQLHGGE